MITTESVSTKYGTITTEWQSFGYGRVYLSDGKINYRDSFDWQIWKTVRGFERFADRLNEYMGGQIGQIEPVRGRINAQMEYEFYN